MTNNERKIQTRLNRITKQRVENFVKPKSVLAMSPRSFCGHSYVTQPYGGGTRFHCPNCDVRRNDYGYMTVSWTNGHTNRRFCNNG